MGKRWICLPASLMFFCLTFLLVDPSSAAERYRVKPGDSLHKIARKHHVGIDALREANRLESDALKPNQVLVIPGKTPSGKNIEKNARKKSPDRDVTFYVVKKGDTLASVAKRTDLSASELRRLNGLQSSKLRPGQKLVVTKVPARVEQDDDDLEEAGSIELSELGADGEGGGTGAGIAPVELSRWRTPDERELFTKVVKSYEGVPYKLGGNTVRGIDCSAFTRKVYSIFGIDLPRTAREQLQRGKRVGRDDLDVGDLVFFQTRRSRIHVGVFLGGSDFFHLSSRNRAGKVDNIDSTYFSTRFLSGVRLKESSRPVEMGIPATPGAPSVSPPALAPRAGPAGNVPASLESTHPPRS